MNSIELSLFSSRINSVCEEMGAVLKRTAFSPNIKDRLDYSCAIFNAEGELCAQAAHIPVHLGSMAYAMADVVTRIDWEQGDMIILNNPFLGGTHLPDVTIIAPLFYQDQLCGFVVNRAHHADIGCDTPGSMPIATHLEDEGVIISPTRIIHKGERDEAMFASLLNQLRNKMISEGDFSAQISANLCGLERLTNIINQITTAHWFHALTALNDYAEALVRSSLKQIPSGQYCFTDVMDDDGQGQFNLPITATIKISSNAIEVDFTGTAQQVKGNINCPLSVAAAAVYYVFYCLMPEETPACAGSFRPIKISAPEGCMVNAQSPAAVAAGNVETSTRIVDVILGALAQAIPDQIPAASHGSMNNIAMGSNDEKNNWDYYETIGGGMGASQQAPGLDGKQTHMTNTLNTPIEVLEMAYPLQITQYSLRQNSAGKGQQRGGNGIVRQYTFLEKTTVSLLGERRENSPWGLNQGQAGQRASASLDQSPLPAKGTFTARPGDKLTIMTAGGGGWGLSPAMNEK